MACMLLSPCCHDDYFLYSVILPVHHIHCLNSLQSTLFDIDPVLRMSHGTRGQLGQNQGHDDPEGSGLPPPPTMAQVLMEIERNLRDSHALLEVKARNSTQQQNEMVTLNNFIHLHPPVVSYSTEPLEADDWLRNIERKLQAGHVADGDKVNYAAYHLEGATSSWWENYLNMRPAGPPTTWNEFCTAFREHHIPKGLMDRKREEFCNLTQGRRTVDEYSREFNRLARYALEEVSTDSKKQERFRRGLNTGLRHELNLHDFASFQVLVNKAIMVEDMKSPTEFRKHPRDDSSSSSGPHKRRIWTQTACLGRTMLRGHPMWRLVHRLCSTQLHRTTRLPALSLGYATSVARRATTLVSVTRTSSKSRTLDHVAEETTTTTLASLPRRSTSPSPHLPPLVDV